MPPRGTPTPRPFYPPNDSTTYRDLLLFEERLKTNAASLQRRKSRYQLFLAQLLLVIAFLLAEVFLPPQSSFLAVPYKWVLRRTLPEVYGPDVEIVLHPYCASGLLFVSVTTLVLFFASGMYSEKIAYANKYVPHANRALRSFNMYLNVRKPSIRSQFSFINPFKKEGSAIDTTHSVSPDSAFAASQPPRSGSTPIAPIPPTSNRRGELIFSSRIDRNFREAYEKYRATFERKREERELLARGKWWQRIIFWKPIEIPPPSTTRAASTSNRVRPSRSSTPPSGAITMRPRDRSRSPMRTSKGTPPPGQPQPSRLRESSVS